MNDSGDLGTITGDPNARTVRLERTLDALPDEVWSALTEPGQLRRWLAPAEIDARAEGELTIDFGGQPDGGVVHGTIRVFDPPRTLEYDWTETGDRRSIVRFELKAAGEATKLTLTHSLLQDGEVANFAAGWFAHLEALSYAVRGVRVSPDQSAQFVKRYEELRPIYADKLTSL